MHLFVSYALGAKGIPSETIDNVVIDTGDSQISSSDDVAAIEQGIVRGFLEASKEKKNDYELTARVISMHRLPL